MSTPGSSTDPPGSRRNGVASGSLVLTAEATELADGRWGCRVEYPDLPGCGAEAVYLDDALDELERLRVGAATPEASPDRRI